MTVDPAALPADSTSAGWILVGEEDVKDSAGSPAPAKGSRGATPAPAVPASSLPQHSSQFTAANEATPPEAGGNILAAQQPVQVTASTAQPDDRPTDDQILQQENRIR